MVAGRRGLPKMLGINSREKAFDQLREAPKQRFRAEKQREKAVPIYGHQNARDRREDGSAPVDCPQRKIELCGRGRTRGQHLSKFVGDPQRIGTSCSKEVDDERRPLGRDASIDRTFKKALTPRNNGSAVQQRRSRDTQRARRHPESEEHGSAVQH